MVGRPRGFDSDEVLSRAMAVFWRLGYDATGLVELEQATGLGRQSLYGAFGDKHALFVRAVDRYFDTVLKPYLIDVLDASGSARANLERVFDQWEATALAPEFHGCLVGNAVSDLRAKDAAMADFLRRKMTLMEEALFRALRRAKRDGEVSATLDARGAARSLLVLSQGLAIVARVHPEPAYVRSVIAQARRLLGDPSAPS